MLSSFKFQLHTIEGTTCYCQLGMMMEIKKVKGELKLFFPIWIAFLILVSQKRQT